MRSNDLSAPAELGRCEPKEIPHMALDFQQVDRWRYWKIELNRFWACAKRRVPE